MFDFESYKIKLQDSMNHVISEYRLFPNSLQYVPNENNTGYSIKIFEEDYPPPKNVSHDKMRGVYSPSAVALVKEINKEKDKYAGTLKITVLASTLDHAALPETAVSVSESSSGKITFVISPCASDLLPYLQKLMEYRIQHYHSSQNNFACCSHFEECSDAKHCVHYNQLYSTGCSYRTLHLDNGEIFYGKNRNIE